MTTTDELYRKVSDICGSIVGYTGTYLIERSAAYSRGEMTVEEFTRELGENDRRFESAVIKLRMLRFPRMQQRAELTKLTSGIMSYRNAIALIIESINTGNDALWHEANRCLDRAYESAGEYAAFVLKDRMEKAAV